MKALPYLLMLCAWAVYAQEIGGGAQTNLLKNAGFEEGGDAPAPWQFATAMPDNFEVGVVADAHTGKRAARVLTKTRQMSGYWTQTVEVLPNTEYLLECWLKLKSGKVLMYVSGQGNEQAKVDRAYVESAHDNPLVPVFLKPEYVPGIPRDDKWHRIELRFKTLPATMQVNVNIGSYFRSGDVFIDDVRLAQVPEASGRKEEK